MAQRKQNKNIINSVKYKVGIVLVILSAFFLLCLILPMIAGVVSRAIKAVTIGSFGFMSYPFFICLLLFGVALIQDRHLRVSKKIIACIGLITFFVALILQLATSQSFIGNGFGDYTAKVFKGFTAGGVLIGTLVYGVQSAITIIFSYIVYSLCLALSVFLLVKDKLLKDSKSKTVSQVPVIDTKAFKKGLHEPLQVRPIADTALFVDTIMPTTKNYDSQQGDFQQLNNFSSNKNDKTQLNKYSTQLNPKYNNNEFEPYQNQDKQDLDKKTKALNFLYGDRDAPFQITPQNKFNQTSTAEAYYSSENNLNSFNQYLPGSAVSAPDIKSNSIDESKPVEIKKPPKVLHISDIPELHEIAMPPPKDITENYKGGTIINGDELSKKLAEMNAPLNKPETPIVISGINNFDTRKYEPTQISPKKDYHYNELESFNKFEENKSIEKEEPLNVAPILNGDYFNIDNFTSQIEEKKSENLFNNQNNNFNENKAKSKVGFDLGSTNNSEKVFSNDENFNKVYENIFNESKKANNSYLDNETVIDMSEKSFDNPNDFTGYYTEVEPSSAKAPPIIMPKLKPENQIKIDDYAKRIAPTDAPKPKKRHTKYNPPPIELLFNSVNNSNDKTENESNEKARLLEETLRGLKLPATVSAITRGPAVTRYELEMPPGIPVKRIEQFAKDIEYNLASNGRIRIETPIPGKRAVGIEVPNEVVDIVGLKEIINSKEFMNSSSPLTIALGKDISGNNIICNLDKMPHLLIAGSTGSGKSACLNSIIISFLYKTSPDDLRIILIDPKHVEFTIYRDMPHLLTNEIITDAQQAFNALKWIKQEMDRRYIQFSKYVVRNLVEYNKLDVVKNGDEDKIPNIVLIVDELAELMMSNNRKDLEDKIMSMAQKARAAGIHLILATQRPSVDVITGTIKSNLPSRIAFAVKSVIDSRTILDASGAETLLGRGDMLYAPLGVDDPKRVQGAYVTNEECATIVDYVRENNPSYFDSDFTNALSSHEESADVSIEEDDNEFDPLMQSVIKLVIETGTASTTFIQRRFAVGYARASRIMDQMETHKFVGPLEGSKPRAVYISREQFKEMYGEEI